MTTQSFIMSRMIAAAAGKFVTVQFVKKDGTLRSINGRLGVHRYIVGTGKPVDPSKYLTIYDVKVKGYRCINKDSIVALRSQGLEVVSTL